MGNKYDETEIDLREMFYAIRRRLAAIIAAGILMAAAAGAYTYFLVTPVYTSTSSMLVLTKETTLSSLADLQMGSQLTNDYQVLITSRPVLEEVIDNLRLGIGYRSLQGRISIENPTDTRILVITVRDSDPETAKEIVNELAEVASEYIGDKMEVVPPKIIEEGEIATSKAGPNMKRNVMLGLFAGLALSAGLVVVMAILDDTIKSEDDISRYLGLPNLANIPDRKDFITGKNGKKKRKKKKGGSK